MNEEEKEAYYFFKEQRAMYNKWVADKTANESDVVLARYYNSLFEILDKQQEELQQEKEKNKKLEEEVKCFRDSYEEVRIEECDTYFLMNKVIDMMATFIGNEDIDEKICKNVDECYRDNEDGDYFPCKACIKEYYFKVAKGEEYKNKYCGGEE
jgi:hypothetical protein